MADVTNPVGPVTTGMVAVVLLIARHLARYVEAAPDLTDNSVRDGIHAEPEDVETAVRLLTHVPESGFGDLLASFFQIDATMLWRRVMTLEPVATDDLPDELRVNSHRVYVIRDEAGPIIYVALTGHSVAPYTRPNITPAREVEASLSPDHRR